MVLTEAERAKILIVDDTPENLQILVDALKRDHTVVVARDGETALHLATSSPIPDLILLDVMMPGMDGYEVCRRLKTDAATREIPVLFVTVMVSEEEERQGLELGAVDYIHKPFATSLVQARVNNHLQLARGKKQLARQNAELLEAARLREEVERLTQHDLKGPLTAVTSLPEVVLEGGGLNDKQRRLLRHIEYSGFLMLKIINQSLDLYRMEMGSYVFQPVVVNLMPIIKRIMLENGPLAEKKGCGLELWVDGAPETGGGIRVLAEALLCHSLFSNLVKNALEAAPGHSTVTIRLDSDTDGAVSVRIHNMGVVPAVIRDRFFDKFITHGKTRGAGLGTYSARLLARVQKGSIHMETSEERGTLLTVRLIAASGPGTMDVQRSTVAPPEIGKRYHA